VPPVAVFDTNVLLSGVGWKGRPYECLELARRGSVDGVTCSELLGELAEKLESKLGFTATQATDTVIDLLTFLRIVPLSGNLVVVIADPDDDKVLDCAVQAGASHIVTGDRRHLLPMGSYQGIEIVTPAQFLAIVSADRQT
jgi:putative PIN family toxin of toxin-antitoxin system